MANPGPSFELRATTIAEVAELFDRYHPYRSTGNAVAYAFALIEDAKPIGAFLWQPPPPGAAKSVCPALPQGVLALSRMVAVPREERRYQHISRPLKWQMKNLIDRVRWPVLVTYSDESCGHTGHVYKCSGWQKTKRRKAPTVTTQDGRRVSTYANGKNSKYAGGQANHAVENVGLSRREARDISDKALGITRGHAWIQRWEHWGGLTPAEAVARFESAWERVAVPGKTWKSGKQAYTYVKKANV